MPRTIRLRLGCPTAAVIRPTNDQRFTGSAPCRTKRVSFCRGTRQSSCGGLPRPRRPPRSAPKASLPFVLGNSVLSWSFDIKWVPKKWVRPSWCFRSDPTWNTCRKRLDTANGKAKHQTADPLPGGSRFMDSRGLGLRQDCWCPGLPFRGGSRVAFQGWPAPIPPSNESYRRVEHTEHVPDAGESAIAPRFSSSVHTRVRNRALPSGFAVPCRACTIAAQRTEQFCPVDDNNKFFGKCRS